MKNTHRTGILLGMGILCAGTFAVNTQSASAAPFRNGESRRDDRKDVKEARKDVKEARKEVRDERKDLRKADTPRERAEERRELADAQRDLRNERGDLRDERNDNRGGSYNNNRPNWNNNNRPNWNNNNRPNWNNNNRPNYPTYNQGRPYYQSQSNSTIEGVVVQDLNGNDFVIRTSNGRQIRVVARNGESNRISRGDVVRVYGYSSNGTFNAQNVSIIRNR